MKSGECQYLFQQYSSSFKRGQIWEIGRSLIAADVEYNKKCLKNILFTTSKDTSHLNLSSISQSLLWQVFKPLVDRVEIFKTKKLPVEFLSDNKLVFQEYSHLRTITVSIWMKMLISLI